MPDVARTPKPRKMRIKRIGHRDREHILSELALLLKSGVAVGTTLHTLRTTSRSRRLRKVLDQMTERIDEGIPLWQVLEQSGLLTSQARALVRLGERSGNLVENMQMAATQEEKQRKFRSKVYSALMYPAFVMSVTLIVSVGVAWFLLPRLADTFSQMNAELPLISKIFVNIGLFLQSNGIWAVPTMFIVLALSVYVLFFAPRTRVIGQWILLHTPGISRLLREIEIARFGYLLGTLLRAGLSITQSLDLMVNSTNMHVYRTLYVHLKESFDEGFGFRASLPRYAHSKLLPPSIQQIIIAGEGSGSLPETLLAVGVTYEEKADMSTQNLETILEPLMLVIVWLGVLAVAIAVILPVYSLVSGLGG